MTDDIVGTQTSIKKNKYKKQIIPAANCYLRWRQLMPCRVRRWLRFIWKFCSRENSRLVWLAKRWHSDINEGANKTAIKTCWCTISFVALYFCQMSYEFIAINKDFNCSFLKSILLTFAAADYKVHKSDLQNVISRISCCNIGFILICIFLVLLAFRPLTFALTDVQIFASKNGWLYWWKLKRKRKF